VAVRSDTIIASSAVLCQGVLCPLCEKALAGVTFSFAFVGLKMTEQPSKKQQASGAPWMESLHHVIRSFPSARVSNPLTLSLSSNGSNPEMSLKNGVMP